MKFQPSTHLLANYRTANQSNVMSLVERSVLTYPVDGRNFVRPAYTPVSIGLNTSRGPPKVSPSTYISDTKGKAILPQHYVNFEATDGFTHSKVIQLLCFLREDFRC